WPCQAPNTGRTRAECHGRRNPFDQVVLGRPRTDDADRGRPTEHEPPAAEYGEPVGISPTVIGPLRLPLVNRPIGRRAAFSLHQPLALCTSVRSEAAPSAAPLFGRRQRTAPGRVRTAAPNLFSP